LGFACNFLSVAQRSPDGDPLLPVFEITAYNTPPDSHDPIHDAQRIACLQSHLRELAIAIRAGAGVRAYHCWSLLDNLEWAQGIRSGLASCTLTLQTDLSGR
jgi:beta-glucosidase